MAHPTKSTLDGTENIQLINEAGGNQLTTTQFIADLAGGGSGGSSFCVNGGFFASNANDYFLNYGLYSSPLNYGHFTTIYYSPLACTIKKVILRYGGSAGSSGSLELEVWVNSVLQETVTVLYSDAVASVFTFDLNTSIPDGASLELRVNNTLSTNWNGSWWSILFEE